MSVVRGKNVVFSIASWFGGGLFSTRILACVRSVTITTTTSFVETTTVGSGKGATYRPQKNVSTASLEGVVFLNDANKITLPVLRQLQFGHVLGKAMIDRTDDDGNNYRDLFDFYISSVADTGSVGDFNTFQMDLQISGDPQIIISENIIPERMVQWRYATVVPFDLSSEVVQYPHSMAHVMGADISIPVTDMLPNKHLIVRYPVDEANFVNWYNTPLNNGTIPDSVFRTITSAGGWKYIITRNEATFDTSQPIKFTH